MYRHTRLNNLLEKRGMLLRTSEILQLRGVGRVGTWLHKTILANEKVKWGARAVVGESCGGSANASEDSFAPIRKGSQFKTERKCHLGKGKKEEVGVIRFRHFLRGGMHELLMV